MTTYFDREQSIEYRLGSETGPVLQTIANRFCADNPAVPVQYSLRSTQGFPLRRIIWTKFFSMKNFHRWNGSSMYTPERGLRPRHPAPFIFASAHMAL